MTMSRRSRLAVIAASVSLSIVCVSPVSGQVRATPEPAFGPGAHVRVTSSCPGTTPARLQLCRDTGTFVGVHGDSLLISAGDSPLLLPRARVQQVELSVGTRRHFLTGLLVGFLGGTAAGAVFAFSKADCTGSIDGPGPGACLGLAMALGGAPLGLIGAGVGATIVSDRWRAVPPESYGGAGAPVGLQGR